MHRVLQIVLAFSMTFSFSVLALSLTHTTFPPPPSSGSIEPLKKRERGREREGKRLVGDEKHGPPSPTPNHTGYHPAIPLEELCDDEGLSVSGGWGNDCLCSVGVSREEALGCPAALPGQLRVAGQFDGRCRSGRWHGGGRGVSGHGIHAAGCGHQVGVFCHLWRRVRRRAVCLPAARAAGQHFLLSAQGGAQESGPGAGRGRQAAVAGRRHAAGERRRGPGALFPVEECRARAVPTGRPGHRGGAALAGRRRLGPASGCAAGSGAVCGGPGRPEPPGGVVGLLHYGCGLHRRPGQQAPRPRTLLGQLLFSFVCLSGVCVGGRGSGRTVVCAAVRHCAGHSQPRAHPACLLGRPAGCCRGPDGRRLSKWARVDGHGAAGLGVHCGCGWHVYGRLCGGCCAVTIANWL
eukprot:m.270489 g.270489  ORF g.270489 m.270489 type:complete len:407 (+) comp22830_c3_seq17:318-1538(+)